MKTLEVVSRNSITTEDSSISEKKREEEGKDTHNKYSFALNVISTILVIFIGIIVLKVTGLYDSMDSTAGKFTLSVVISFSYMIALRRGLYSR